jgi:cytochrome c oxidase assembly factor CtaG
MNLHLLENYPLTAHMLGHFVLVMLAPPLVVWALPANTAERIRISPLLCWMTGIAAMSLWHFPPFFNAAMQYPVLHHAAQVAFFLTALVYWWPVFNPVPAARIHPLTAVAYLSTGCICCTAIGIAIAFAPPQLYAMAFHAGHRVGTEKADQQFAGLLLWVPGCIVYLSAMLVRLGGWFNQSGAWDHAELGET